MPDTNTNENPGFIEENVGPLSAVVAENLIALGTNANGGTVNIVARSNVGSVLFSVVAEVVQTANADGNGSDFAFNIAGATAAAATGVVTTAALNAAIATLFGAALSAPLAGGAVAVGVAVAGAAGGIIAVNAVSNVLLPIVNDVLAPDTTVTVRNAAGEELI